MAVETGQLSATRADVATQRLVTRTLLSVWGGGTTIFLITLVFAPPPRSGRLPDWFIVGCGYMMFAGFVLCRRRLATWAIDLNGYVGVFCASTVTAASANTSTSYALFYLWVTVLSCHFLPLRRAIPQISLVPIGYFAALLVAGGDFPWVRWTLLSATVAVVGFSVAFLRQQAEALLAIVATQARTDALTGLLNRRAFEEELEAEVSRAQRNGQTVALLIADLDHFKVINDRYGHPAGDDVLRRVSEILRSQCRQTDRAFRIGGEEFAVIAPNAGAGVAAALANRIGQAVRSDSGGTVTHVTLSVGVATYPDHGDDAATLAMAADASCYRAKREGRDRTIVSSNHLPHQRTARNPIDA